MQVVPQLIPAGLLVTVPVPVPARITPSIAAPWVGVNVAVIFSLALIVTTQVGPLPQPPPVHPAKDELAPAVALRVTMVPAANAALHVCSQLLMPDGSLLTLPVPLPASATVRTGEVLKFAITEVFCVNVTLHAPVPLQAPDHPANEEFAAGDAVSATWLPLAKLALQV